MGNNRLLRHAVRTALTAGAFAVVYAGNGARAQSQQIVAPPDTGVSLDEVLVTGTKVRRVDAQTATPLIVIDSVAIEQSGAVIVGDILQRLPELAGVFTNPQNGSGGQGTGASTISLRGLGVSRTLVLLDGRRMGIGATDVNTIPVNMIERVEVLKEGAGAIYGSDAIGGVVNFITRKPTNGVEVSGDYGRTSKADGAHHSLGVIFGSTTDRSEITVGANYNQQDEIKAGARAFSQYALYLYSGQFHRGGSSATPTGRIFLTPSLQAQFGCSSVTRAAGATGTSLADYGCYGSGGPYAGSYNFQPENLLLTGQERGSLFFKSSFRINDYVEAYGEAVYTHTHAGQGLSPYGFSANRDEVVISKDSIYNPFGIDFGGGAAVGGVNPNISLRLTGAGDRTSDSIGTSTLIYGGIRGELPLRDWRWDAVFSYTRNESSVSLQGYQQTAALRAAVGPSFFSAAGAPTCGTSSQPILNCIPLNVFNQSAPGQAAALQAIAANAIDVGTTRYKSFNLDVNGTAVTLPAGNALANAGVDYMGLDAVTEVDSLSALQPPTYTTCGIASQACRSGFSGAYNVREAYGELFVPLLKDLPGAKALNVDLGVRYSDYSVSGRTSRGEFKLEYRPVSDLLIRGTYAQVFRAPGVSDLFGAPSGAEFSFVDPCSHYTGTSTVQYPHLTTACAGVPTNGSFQLPNATVPTLTTGNPDLKPEHGHVATGGFLFNPRWLQNLQLSIDYWAYTVDDTISDINPTFAASQCAITGAANYCNLSQRYTSGPNVGQFIIFNSPTFNLGSLETDGVDVGLNFALPGTSSGSWRFSLDSTYINSYKQAVLPGTAPIEYAGQFNLVVGNIARVRALASAGWSNWGADALLSVRYVGSLEVPTADPSPAPDGSQVNLGLHIPSVIYFDLTAGYTFSTGTRVQLNVVNLADKQPPIFADFATAGGNTDSNTYDEIGRRFNVSFVQKF